ncbi:undecaprenyl-diphosphate phosphatase [Frankia sp. AgB1.9]|uniref:undecaprenyl-diphosphate phosphatase n=1 Tax=unclassified Frankia TaxID=2632575 RepID=UPI00193128C3|nr:MULTISPECIES: undecaprenyl-diphosphate phosphatase [unclassified Frankia]MBL7490495.1 undecaprenyl-diphosphate phosphatase [Frankia sp. AgW1.1]MBL7552091.1 undecaprenyl-diphosphate phosphatase [Frankia sp. AgB1.9]MBL7620580.1 undecaprenyl-diphosphate phosphatase [Frankia sp. AgB1.8]
MSSDLTYLQSGVIGVLQGATELFPVSSLGHSVIIPALIGGSWKHLVTENSADKSPYLAFIVALHVATALALLIFYRSDWVRLIRAFGQTLRSRKIETSEQRLAWMVIVGTIPTGVIGLALEHTLRTIFAKPVAVSVFLAINGVVLYTGQRMRDRSERSSVAGAQSRDGLTSPLARADGAAIAEAGYPATAGGGDAPTLALRIPGRSRSRVPAQAGAGQGAAHPTGRGRAKTLENLTVKEATVIGLYQSLALLAGISRSGVTMIGSLSRGLNNEDAARFAFLLATPIILAAGLFKLPELAGSETKGIHGQIVFGAVLAGIAAYLTTRFLVRYFETRTLTPFAIYCFVAGVLCTVRFAFF